MKVSLITIAIVSILSAIYSLFQTDHLTGFVNAMFIIGMFTFAYSGFQFLKELGAYRFVTYSFKRVGAKIKLSFLMGANKNMEVADHIDEEKKEVRIEDYLVVEKHAYTFPLFISSLALVITSIVLSFAFVI